MKSFIRQLYKKLDSPNMKTVFVDRDGTLNKDFGYISNPNKLELLKGVVKGIKKLNKINITIIVISNQPVVARGLATVKKLKKINNTLVEILKEKGANINAIYSCPHHPEIHHSDIPKNAMKFRLNCNCRKPKLGMFEKAIEDFKINLKYTFIIGDRASDIKAGENLGIKTILLKTDNKNLGNTNSILPTYLVDNFIEATDIIISS